MAFQSGIPIMVYNPEGPDQTKPDWMTAIAPDGWKSDNQPTAQTMKVLWTPATGRRILFMGVLISSEVARYIRIETAGEVLIPPVYLGATGGANILFLNGLLLGVNANISYSSWNDGGHSVMLYGKEF